MIDLLRLAHLASLVALTTAFASPGAPARPSRVRTETRPTSMPSKGSFGRGGPTNGWVDAALDAGDLIRRDAGNTRVPVLLVQPSDEAFVKLEAHTTVCNRINAAGNGASCRLVPIAGAKHETFKETDSFRRQALGPILTFLGQA
jgi:alpha-beta hydrolase superfamily lysophospholipase